MYLPEPFGGFILIILVALCTLGGISLSIRGRNRKKSILKGISLMLLPWFILTILSIISPGIDEWNPTISSDSQAIGIWQGDNHSLTLDADHTFTADLNGLKRSGTWSRHDWNLTLTPSTGETLLMRFVEENGELLLLPSPPAEPGPPGPITRKQ